MKKAPDNEMRKVFQQKFQNYAPVPEDSDELRANVFENLNKPFLVRIKAYWYAPVIGLVLLGGLFWLYQIAFRASNDEPKKALPTALNKSIVKHYKIHPDEKDLVTRPPKKHLSTKHLSVMDTQTGVTVSLPLTKSSTQEYKVPEVSLPKSRVPSPRQVISSQKIANTPNHQQLIDKNAKNDSFISHRNSDLRLGQQNALDNQKDGLESNRSQAIDIFLLPSQPIRHVPENYAFTRFEHQTVKGAVKPKKQKRLTKSGLYIEWSPFAQYNHFIPDQQDSLFVAGFQKTQIAERWGWQLSLGSTFKVNERLSVFAGATIQNTQFNVKYHLQGSKVVGQENITNPSTGQTETVYLYDEWQRTLSLNAQSWGVEVGALYQMTKKRLVNQGMSVGLSYQNFDFRANQPELSVENYIKNQQMFLGIGYHLDYYLMKNIALYIKPQIRYGFSANSTGYFQIKPFQVGVGFGLRYIFMK